MKLQMTPRFPAQLVGGDGVAIAKANGTYTFSSDTINANTGVRTLQTGIAGATPGTNSAANPGLPFLAYNIMEITNDSAQPTGGSDGITYGHFVALTTGGNGSDRAKVAINGRVNKTASSTPVGNRDTIGVNGQVIVSAGAQDSANHGNYYGTAAQCISSATGTNAVVGHESSVGISSPGSSTVRHGHMVAAQGNLQATGDDAAYAIASVNAGASWKVGLSFGQQGGQAPIGLTGTLIKTEGSYTVANGFDGSSYTFTGYFLKGPGFTVDGSGSIVSTSANAAALAIGTAANPAFKVNSAAASQASGVLITGQAAGNGVAITAISSATNEALVVSAKGNGTLLFQSASTGVSAFTTDAVSSVDGAASLGSASQNWGGLFVKGSMVQGSNTTDRVTIKGQYMNPAVIAVAVPSIANDAAENVDSVAVDVSAAFSMQPAVGDAVIAIPMEALPTDCLLLGAYVTATDTITVTFGSKEGGGGVTGANKNFNFLITDLT